jgi:chromosome segregation ATPase
MSTAGKVLVVLVMLVAAIWTVLASGVAELNKSGGDQVAQLNEKVAATEKELAAATRKLAQLKDQIALEQEAMKDHLAVIRAQKADLEKARSETIEIATRVKFQVAAMQEAVKRAETTKEFRQNELSQEVEAKAAAERTVEQLKQEHAELTEQLNQLRSKFKSTLDSNRQLLGRLKATKSS